MDQHGTPSYLDERDKGLFYALMVNYSSHMIVVEILDYETGDVVWTSKTLLTEEESLKRNPQKSFKGRPELMDGAGHVCHIYLYEGTYIMRIMKWCEHGQTWKHGGDHKFVIAKECEDINIPCFDVNDRSNQGPPELAIYDSPHDQNSGCDCAH